ncbi:hypothetical protein [Streptomyces sp. H39-S7]|uniref:hypothetical protein n=1 Tax=Streptomyces sp. H39-S7 TaxID=3004357 RepID=UPI0022AF9AD3|nr:hypothetical protein [Streptomyces sp. H39-S7]MCZ4125453.1 hypothetical protein [Streptomyces sp. H39-S7]
MDEGSGGIDFARALIQRRAQRKSPAEIGQLLSEARDWERQAGRTQESGFQAAHQAAEWKRIADLVRVQEWPAYDLALDEQAQAWTAQREARLQEQRERAERLRRERVERAQERELYVRLPGPVAQRLETLGRELGVGPERVLAVLAEHVQASDGGLLRVPAVPVAGGTTPGADDLGRLERFVRETVLPRTHPNTSKRRQVLEALGEAGGLCTAQKVELSTGDIVLCTREAGHYNPDDKPSGADWSPDGWHRCNSSVWDDSISYSRPHTAGR